MNFLFENKAKIQLFQFKNEEFEIIHLPNIIKKKTKEVDITNMIHTMFIESEINKNLKLQNILHNYKSDSIQNKNFISYIQK